MLFYRAHAMPLRDGTPLLRRVTALARRCHVLDVVRAPRMTSGVPVVALGGLRGSAVPAEPAVRGQQLPPFGLGMPARRAVGLVACSSLVLAMALGVRPNPATGSFPVLFWIRSVVLAHDLARAGLAASRSPIMGTRLNVELLQRLQCSTCRAGLHVDALASLRQLDEHHQRPASTSTPQPGQGAS